MSLWMLFQLAAAVILLIVCYLSYKILTSSKHPNIVRYEAEKSFMSANGEKRKKFPSLMDQPSVYLSVVVPSYNEEERLPVMMDETLEFLEAKIANKKSCWGMEGYEIIVVDDGSRDGTSKVAMKYVEKFGDDKVRVLTLAKNRGKGGAVRLGMLSARGRYVLFVDADGATKFSDLDKLFVEIERLPQDRAIAVGSRSHLEQESIAERSFFRTILMKGFHLVVWLFCVRSVHDSQCGFKLLTREAAQICFLNLHVERWAFDVELLLIAEKLSIDVAEVAVNWVEVDGSKVVPVFTWLQMGHDIFLIWLHYFLRLWKIKEVTA